MPPTSGFRIRFAIALAAPRLTRPTIAAAPPPTPLRSATSWGMFVMAIRRATGTERAAPTITAARASQSRNPTNSVERNTVTIATNAPNAPSALPLRAVRGPERPFKARMKQTAANK